MAGKGAGSSLATSTVWRKGGKKKKKGMKRKEYDDQRVLLPKVLKVQW